MIKRIFFTIAFLFLIATQGWGANRYWVGNTGNWNDTAKWSDSDGGAGGQSVPGSSDIAYVTAASLSSASIITINATASVTSLIITGLDCQLNLQLSANLTCSGTFQFNGLNATTGRGFIYSNTLGTARTISAGTVTITQCDFRDTAGTGAGSWDLSAITGGSGDCGGNTGITFTTADDLYWVGGTGNWSDTAHWDTSSGGGGGARVPLPQDTCYFDNGSDSGNFTITADMPRLGKTIDTSGYSDASTFTMTWNTLDITMYGSLDLTGVDTFNRSKYLYLEGRGSFTLNFGSLGAGSRLYFQAIGGTYTLLSNCNPSADIYVSNGTLDADTYDLQSTSFAISGTSIRSVLMGSGSWNSVRNGAGNEWNASTTTNLTFDAETSTINLTNLNYSCTFEGGDLTYNNIVARTNTGTTLIKGSNTFNTFTINAPKTVNLTAGTTTTVNSLVATGDAGNLIHIDSTTSTAVSLVDTAGTNTVHYCHIGETGAVNVSGGATWDASDNCEVNMSEGWTVATARGLVNIIRF